MSSFQGVLNYVFGTEKSVLLMEVSSGVLIEGFHCMSTVCTCGIRKEQEKAGQEGKAVNFTETMHSRVYKHEKEER